MVHTQEAEADRSLSLRLAWATQKSYVIKKNPKQIKMCLSITISWFLFAWSFETVSLHSPSGSETYNLDQAGLESDKIKAVCQSSPAQFYILESDRVGLRHSSICPGGPWLQHTRNPSALEAEAGRERAL